VHARHSPSLIIAHAHHRNRIELLLLVGSVVCRWPSLAEVASATCLTSIVPWCMGDCWRRAGDLSLTFSTVS